MGHCIVPEAEAILDKEIKVLDKGFVRLVDYMGNDGRIVQAARVSYGEGTTTFRRDKLLIDYLLENDHTSPFEQVVFTFHVKMPIFVARQWIRHRTARVNEISGRYSVMNNEYYIPAKEDIGAQSSSNRQGRDTDSLSDEIKDKTVQLLKKTTEQSYADYEEMINDKVAREIARINLPLCLYTEMYWEIDLHNLLRFIKLRLDHHAQKEIREYAQVLANIGRTVCPMAFDAFDKYVFNTLRFSSEEVEVLKNAIQNTELDKEDKIVKKVINKLIPENSDS